jgi:hypothetical protein
MRITLHRPTKGNMAISSPVSYTLRKPGSHIILSGCCMLSAAVELIFLCVLHLTAHSFLLRKLRDGKWQCMFTAFVSSCEIVIHFICTSLNSQTQWNRFPDSNFEYILVRNSLSSKSLASLKFFLSHFAIIIRTRGSVLKISLNYPWLKVVHVDCHLYRTISAEGQRGRWSGLHVRCPWKQNLLQESLFV